MNPEFSHTFKQLDCFDTHTKKVFPSPIFERAGNPNYLANFARRKKFSFGHSLYLTYFYSLQGASFVSAWEALLLSSFTNSSLAASAAPSVPRRRSRPFEVTPCHATASDTVKATTTVQFQTLHQDEYNIRALPRTDFVLDWRYGHHKSMLI